MSTNYFLRDPDGDDWVEFATAEERDAYAKNLMDTCSDAPEWDSGVEHIRVGIITGRAERVRVERRPPESDPDENDCDKDGQHWPDGINERYDVEIVPTGPPVLHHIVTCHGCGALLGYSAVMTSAMDGAICGECCGECAQAAMDGAICGECAITTSSALAEIREIVESAINASDLSKLNLARILKLCREEKR